MAESIQCPECQRKYPFKAELTGKKVRCAQCQSTFVVAEPSNAGLAAFFDEELPVPNAAADAASDADGWDDYGFASEDGTAGDPVPALPAKEREKHRKAALREQAVEVFSERVRDGDQFSKLMAAIGMCTMVFPALSQTGFFFELPESISQSMLLVISAIGSMAIFCLYYPDRTLWYVGILAGLITGPCVFTATVLYTENRESIWTLELVFVGLIAAAPGMILWYVPLRFLAVRRLEQELRKVR